MNYEFHLIKMKNIVIPVDLKFFGLINELFRFEKLKNGEFLDYQLNL